MALLRRGQRSVEELAHALSLTDNAVRAQLATLARDGVVESIGVRRDGAAGKPAMIYGIAPGALTLFSGAYAPVLSALLAELGAKTSSRQLDALLRGAGRRLASALPAQAGFDTRARAGAAFLNDLGAETDLIKTSSGYELLGHGCPLADAVIACPSTCHAVEELLSAITHANVRDMCDRTAQPRCRFVISAPV